MDNISIVLQDTRFMFMSRFKTSLLLSYICIASVSAAIITPALPQIELTYSLSHGALEWIMSIFLLGYVIGQLIYGPLANRFGRLNALRSGLVINLLGISLCIVSVYFSSYALLLFGRLVTALGAAAGLSCTFILLNESLSKEQAKRAMSFAVVSFTLGIGIAVTLGGIISQHLHWQYCFAVLLVHGFIMLGLTWQFQETLQKPLELHPLRILSGYLSALKNKRLIVFSLTVGLVSAVAYCYSAAAPLYAHSVLHLTPDIYGYWNLLNMLGMLTSGFLSAYLMKTHGAQRTLFVGLGFMIPCLMSFLLMSITQQSNALWFFTTSMFLYLFSGLLFPAASFFASNAIEDKANASSMMSFVNMGSAMVAVAVMGYLPLRTIVSFTITISVFFIIVSVLSLQSIKRNAQI